MKKLKQILSLLPLLCLFSCTDIEGLNDYNAVFSFEITESKGQDGSIEIGKPVVSGDDIVIPVMHGIHNFPLYIKGEPKFENPIDRIVGIDFSDWVEIDLKRDADDNPVMDENGNYIFNEPKFYIQALSGLPREYTIKVDYMATSDDAKVYSDIVFEGLSSDDIVANIATVKYAETSEEGNLVLINVANPTYPLSLTPLFTVGDGATLENNGQTTYEFKDATTRFSFDVVAKDGTVKTWSLGLDVLPIVNTNTPGIDAVQLSLTNLDKFTAIPDSKGFVIEEYRYSASENSGAVASKVKALVKGATVVKASTKIVASKIVKSTTEGYFASDTLKLYINTFSGNPFPVTVSMDASVAKSVAVVGLEDMMTFNTIKAVNEFYMLDTGNEIARRWVIALEEYKSSIATVTSASFTYSASQVKESSTVFRPAIVLDEKDVDIDPINRTITMRATEIYKTTNTISNPWKLTVKIAIGLTPGASLTELEPLEYNGNDSWKDVRTFGVKASDGVVYQWKIVIRDWRNGSPSASDECNLYNATVKEVRPYVVELDPIEPIVIDKNTHSITINLKKDDSGYPISIWLDYTLSEYARITTQNGGRNPLIFNSPESVETVEVMSESGKESQNWTVKLKAPSKESGTNVTSFQILSFSDNRFAGEVVGIDTQNAVVNMNFTQIASFPVTMNLRMGISYKAVSSIADASGYGSLNFSKIENKTFTVTAQDGTQRTWTLKTDYQPQLQNANLEQWSDYYTPVPKGIQGSPYWATANMTSPVAVIGTTETESIPGQGKAAQLKTSSTVGKLASGSLFLGWFDSSNPLGNLNDPAVMMYMGMPFSASREIKGFEVDVNYHPGKGPASDGGSLAIELIRQDDLSQPLVYHPAGQNGVPHAKNNAVKVAGGKEIVAIQSGKLTTGDVPTKVVKDGVWERIFVPLSYTGVYPQYTHLTVIFSSSSKGDSFVGSVDSTMKIDNIRLVYEE